MKSDEPSWQPGPDAGRSAVPVTENRDCEAAVFDFATSLLTDAIAFTGFGAVVKGLRIARVGRLKATSNLIEFMASAFISFDAKNTSRAIALTIGKNSFAVATGNVGAALAGERFSASDFVIGAFKGLVPGVSTGLASWKVATSCF